MKRLLTFIALLSLTLFISSCAGGGRRHGIIPNTLNPVYKIAILPLYNDTSSVKGPVVVRRGLFKKLERYHYSIKSIEETDKILRDRVGVTLGKQIPLVEIELLKNELDVDALVYGYLLNFDSVTLGVYNVRKVRAAFRLVDADSGETLWSRGQGVQTTMRSKGTSSIFKASKNAALPARIPGLQGIPGADKWKTLKDFKDVRPDVGFALGLTELLVAKTLRINLRRETRKMLDIIVRDFPIGPGEAGGIYGYKEGAVIEEDVRGSSLFFPTPYLGLKEKDDFTASITMTVTDKDNGRKDSFDLIITKRAYDIRSAYLGADEEEEIVIITKSTGEELLLYPKNKKFIRMKNAEINSKEEVSKDFAGVEILEGKTIKKYSVTILKNNEVIRQGHVWEHNGFPVKAGFEDDNSKTTLIIEDVNFGQPLSILFEIPEEYTETKPYELMNPN